MTLKEDSEFADDDSANEALCEMLGIPSLSLVVDSDETDENLKGEPQKSLDDLLRIEDSVIQNLAQANRWQEEYESMSVFIFPTELSVPPQVMRQLTDELVWGGERYPSDKTYETIRNKNGTQERTLTRLENFVNTHSEWNLLCNNYLQRLVSVALGEPMALFKEKLNLKPPRGTGFAPHLDTPSLRIALGEDGPENFVTVMVAIDDMTIQNGCLRVCKGPWSELHHVETIPPQDDNPDAGGRAGAIPGPVANDLDFQDLVVKSGTIAAFSGWMPHRSAANTSAFGRRAVFLTYNPASEGSWHDTYYAKMEEMRNNWRSKVGLSSRQLSVDEQSELDALATIPRI